MTMWALVEKYFKKNGNWGDWRRIRPELLACIFILRVKVDMPFIVHCAYETTGHSKNSKHYSGRAVDFHVVSSNNNYKEIVTLMLDAIEEIGISKRIGIGIYPGWDKPGFHVDVRGYGASWGRVDGEYISLEKCMRML